MVLNNRISLKSAASFTQTGGAQTKLEFSGDAVAVYGTVSPDHANYTIAIDENPAQAFDGGSNGVASTLHLQVRTQNRNTPCDFC